MKDFERIPREMAQSLEMAANGDIEGAVRLSGDMLARVNNMWRKAHNEGDRTAERDALSLMLLAAGQHVDQLIAIHAYIDAYSTAVATLFIAAREDCPSGVNADDEAAMALYTDALTALLMQISRFEPQSQQDVEHVNAITRYVASMLYYYYNKVKSHTPGAEGLPEAYQTLDIVRKMVPVDTPLIRVLDQDVDPAKPLPLFADLLGRSRAMALLDVD